MTHCLCKPSWSQLVLHCSWSRRSRLRSPRRSPVPAWKNPKLHETSNSSSQLSEWVFSGTFRYPVSHVYLLFSVTLTFMEALSSEASYWAVLFIRPKIRASREPDSAPFRALTRSWHNHRHRVKNHFRNNHLYKSKKFRICCISHCLFCLSVSLIFPSTFRVKVLFLAHDSKHEMLAVGWITTMAASRPLGLHQAPNGGLSVDFRFVQVWFVYSYFPVITEISILFMIIIISHLLKQDLKNNLSVADFCCPPKVCRFMKNSEDNLWNYKFAKN